MKKALDFETEMQIFDLLSVDNIVFVEVFERE